MRIDVQSDIEINKMKHRKMFSSVDSVLHLVNFFDGWFSSTRAREPIHQVRPHLNAINYK